VPYINATDWPTVRTALESAAEAGLADAGTAVSQALDILDKAERGVADKALRDQAEDLHGSNEVEIDDEGAGTSPADGGTWVQAWVWVPIAEDDEAEE